MPINSISEFSSIGAGGIQDLMSQGYRPIQRQKSSVRVNAAARLVADALNGRIDPFLVQEAMRPTNEVFVEHLAQRYPGLYGDGYRLQGLRESMSTTDYKAFFLDVLDIKYYGYYKDWPISMYSCVKRHTCNDFRIVRSYAYDGLVSPFTKVNPAAPAPMSSLTGPVPQGGATPATADTAGIDYQPEAYQAGASFTWAAGVNDFLGILKEVPKRLAMEGGRGISKFLSAFFWDINGPSALLYKAGYKNIINTANGASSTNPALDAQGLQDGFTVLDNMVDSSGNPIMWDGITVYLIHSRTERVTVKNLMNTMTSNISVTGGTQAGNTGFPAYQLTVNNWMKAEIVPVMDPYLNLIATNHPHSWALVVDPEGVNRPAVEVGELGTHKIPQIYQRMPNMQRLDGGVDPTMGQFDTLTNDMKIIWVGGGNQIDGRCTVASNGSGS